MTILAAYLLLTDGLVPVGEREHPRPAENRDHGLHQLESPP